MGYVLAFGAGSPSLSRAVAEAAPRVRVTVAELSEGMLRALRRDPAIHRAVSTYDGPDRAFDLVMASHALEHVVNAAATLRDWCGLLRPGGVLFVEVPHATGDHYTVPHEYIPHTWFFTGLSLDLLARAAGLKTMSILTGGLTYPDAIAGRPAPPPETWGETGHAGCQLRGLWLKPL